MKKGLFVFLLFSTTIGYSQTDFKKGFVITKKNDTIRGLIDNRGDISNSKVCYFKKENSDSIFALEPFFVSSYKFIESGKYYISKQISLKNESRNLFLEYLLKGKVNLYYYRDKDGNHFLIDKDTLKLVELKPIYKLINKDGSLYNWKDYQTEETLKKYMSDCPAIFPEIQHINLDYKPLIKLAENYHNSVCKDEQCVIYKKKVPLNLFIEPQIGLIEFNGNSFGAEFGCLFYNWMPFMNEKLYFKTGLLYSYTSYDSAKSNIFKIPLQLEYLYPHGNVRPIFDFGFNALAYGNKNENEKFDLTIPLDFGLNFIISEKSSIKISYGIELVNPTIMLGGKAGKVIISNSFVIGLKMKIK